MWSGNGDEERMILHHPETVCPATYVFRMLATHRPGRSLKKGKTKAGCSREGAKVLILSGTFVSTNSFPWMILCTSKRAKVYSMCCDQGKQSSQLFRQI